MAFNLDIENGIKAIAIILMLSMAGISIAFSYEGETLEAIYYMLGGTVTLLFYILYKMVQLNRLNHARINLLTKELEESGLIKPVDQTQEKAQETGTDYVQQVKDKIDEVTHGTETKTGDEIVEEVKQETSLKEEDLEKSEEKND